MTENAPRGVQPRRPRWCRHWSSVRPTSSPQVQTDVVACPLGSFESHLVYEAQHHGWHSPAVDREDPYDKLVVGALKQLPPRMEQPVAVERVEFLPLPVFREIMLMELFGNEARVARAGEIYDHRVSGVGLSLGWHRSHIRGKRHLARRVPCSGSSAPSSGPVAAHPHLCRG